MNQPYKKLPLDSIKYSFGTYSWL